MKMVFRDRYIEWLCVLVLVLWTDQSIEGRIVKKYNFNNRILLPYSRPSSGTKVHDGTIEKSVPKFLGTAWMKSKGSDMYWAGIAIGLGRNYALIHQDTYRDIVTGGNVQNIYGHLNKVVIPSDLEIRVQTSGFKGKKQTMKLVKSGLGGKQFNLVKIMDEFGSIRDTFERPALEASLNNTVDDCRAYSWAKISGDKSSPVSRYFSSLPVKSAHCDSDSGDCQINLAPDNGNICPTNGDRGIPILCGPNRKLTYLVYEVFSEGCIEYGIGAIHVASIMDDLEKCIDIRAETEDDNDDD